MGRLRSAWSGVVQRLKRSDEDHPKTVHIITGFFFLVNYEIGTGFLGMPFAFYHAGILVSAITLLVAGFASWVSAVWVLEVMARAQVYIYIFIYLYTYKVDVEMACSGI